MSVLDENDARLIFEQVKVRIESIPREHRAKVAWRLIELIAARWTRPGTP